jgi:hypothetical protein
MVHLGAVVNKNAKEIAPTPALATEGTLLPTLPHARTLCRVPPRVQSTHRDEGDGQGKGHSRNGRHCAHITAWRSTFCSAAAYTAAA